MSQGILFGGLSESRQGVEETEIACPFPRGHLAGRTRPSHSYCNLLVLLN